MFFTTIGAIVVVSPNLMSPTCGLPDLLAGVGIHRDGMVVQRVVDDLAVGKTRAAVDNVAAGDPDRTNVRIGVKDPLLWEARLGDIERDQIIRKRRDNIKRVIDNQRLAFESMRYAGGRRWLRHAGSARCRC